MKILIAGWFSFEVMGATAGDLLCKDILCDWFDKEKIPYDVALSPPFVGGVRWEKTTPQDYTHVVFTCGPFGNGYPVTEFLDHFKGCRLIGINLSMLQSLDEWNPFDLLLERDSSRTCNPDLTFLSTAKKVPIVGLVLVEPQKEYGKRARHQEANKTIKNLLEKQLCAIVPIDTRLDVPNKGGLRTPEEIESLISRMDLVITTRLHGMVLALKNDVPVLAVDAIEGGAKIAKQAKVIGWPNIIIIDNLNEKSILEGYEYCLTKECAVKIRKCYESVNNQLKNIKNNVINFINNK